MSLRPAAPLAQAESQRVAPVFLFWIGYLAISLLVGFLTRLAIPTTVWQLTAWGFLCTPLLLVLARSLSKGSTKTRLRDSLSPLAVGGLAIGFSIGAATFVLHAFVVTTFAEPVEFERNLDVGYAAALLYCARFLSTSCMEEVGFRGFTLERLSSRFGIWSAVALTALVFGLSHLSYGWGMQTILIGVVPFGFAWGMSAIATGGLAVPIGLHAAWNFSAWFSGARKEAGFFQMVPTSDAVESGDLIGTVSYLTVCFGTTLGFWWVYRRRAMASVPEHG